MTEEEAIIFKASDEIFQMFSGILFRIVDRVTSGCFDGLEKEAAAVKFEDVSDVVKAAVESVKKLTKP